MQLALLLCNLTYIFTIPLLGVDLIFSSLRILILALFFMFITEGITWKNNEKRNEKLISYYYRLRKKCPYSELFWSAFSRIRTEYGEIPSISPYSFRMRENADQNNSEYGHFSRIDHHYCFLLGITATSNIINTTTTTTSDCNHFRSS